MTLLTLLRTLSLGYFSQHRTRTLLIVLSIALGVATLVATQALNRSIKSGVHEGVNPLASLADLLIVNGQAGVPANLAGELRKAEIEGVEEVTPFVLSRMSLVSKELKNRVIWLIGVDWSEAKKQQPADAGNPLGLTIKQTYEPKSLLERARLLVAPPALVSDNLAADFAKINPDQHQFRIRNAGRTPELTVVGTVNFENSSLPLKNSSVVIVDLPTASIICYPEVERRADVPINQIGVRVQKGADVEQVRKSISTWLNKRAQVQTIDASRGMVSDVTVGLEIGFAIGGAGALVVGLFLVYNALSVSVAERRHDIGILRSVGATRRQIAGLFVGESLVMGLCGSGLGLPLGWLLAWLALKPISNVVTDLLVPIDNAQIQLSGSLMTVALLSGAVVAVLAALVPALQAASEEPADAVRRVPRKHPVMFAFAQILASAGLLLAGFILAGYRHQIDYYLGPKVSMFAGIVCLLLGGLVATPLLASLVGRVVQPLFRHFLGLEGRLAADNLVRAPGRTGLVIAALAATGGLMVQTAGFLRSSKEAIYEWVEEKIAADLFVSAGSPATSGGAALSMQEDMQQKLLAIEGVDAVLPVRFMRLDYRSPVDNKNRIVFLLGIDTQGFAHAGGERALARNMARFPRLKEPNTVLVSENFASLYRVKIGDTITIPGRKKHINVEIIGTVEDYTWNRGTLIMDLPAFRKEFADHQVDVLDVFLKPGIDQEEVRKTIETKYGDDEALFVISRKEVHDDVRSTLQKVYSIAYAQQGVVGMVALLGVVSSLFISVLQRRRELGLLRAVGATQAQILRSVLAEAILMGIIGAAVGFGIGLLLEWYVIDILLLDESGFRFPMRIPWYEAGIVSGASILLATLAGLWPAYLATRLRIPDAIAYE